MEKQIIACIHLFITYFNAVLNGFIDFNGGFTNKAGGNIFLKFLFVNSGYGISIFG